MTGHRSSSRAVFALALIVASIAVSSAVPSGRALGEEVSPEDLVRELEKARRACDAELTSSRDGQGIDVARIRAEAARLEGIQVKTARGPVDADPRLAGDLTALDETDSPGVREERLAQLHHKLEGIEREAKRALARAPRTPGPEPAPGASPTPPAPGERPTAEDARRALGKVLDRPQYRRRTATEAEASGLQEKLESLSQRFLNWFERFLQPGAPIVWPAWLQTIATFLIGLLPTTLRAAAVWVVVVVLLIALVVVRRERRKRREASDDAPGDEGYDGEKVPERRDPEDGFSEAQWRREARLLAERGELRGAVRALYTGVLLVLQRGGLLRFDKGKTNWEHLRELRKNDRHLATRLEPLTRTFDVAWYGRGAVERGTYDEFLAKADELARTVEKGAPPPGEGSP